MIQVWIRGCTAYEAILHEMISEVHDYDHPQHYGTYMPEQEYISRFYGTFDQWTHLSCNFNFEIDKNEAQSAIIYPTFLVPVYCQIAVEAHQFHHVPPCFADVATLHA